MHAHAEQLSWSVCVTSLVLIAHAVFLLEHGHTDTHTVTDTTDHPTHASAMPAWYNGVEYNYARV